MKYLYGASVQGIQGFIFETNELKTIIGASEIVEGINKTIEKKYKKHIVVNAAGNIKLVFDDKSQFKELVEKFTKEMRQGAFGITLSQAVVSFEEGGLKDAFNLLEKKLMEARNQAQIPLDMSMHLLKLAPKTAKPIVENNKDMATLQKEGAYTHDAQFGQIGRVKNQKNKIAIIHADGNGLGAMIASMSNKITEKDKTKEDKIKIDAAVREMYQTFSKNIEIATNKAIGRAEEEVYGLKLRKVIVGGDDLTVICDANSALEFTHKYLRYFEKETQLIFGDEGLTACAGIAYCNHKYPFHYAVNLAESLCVESKRHSKEINRDLAPSSLMFHNIQSSNFSNFQDYIDSELTLRPIDSEKIYLNYGPYFVNKQEDYSTIQTFIFLVEALRVQGSPMSRLRDWLTLLGQDSHTAKVRLERIVEMMNLRDDIYKKSSLVNALNKFNEQIELNKLTFRRGEKLYSPIHDVDTHLSVVDARRDDEV